MTTEDHGRSKYHRVIKDVDGQGIALVDVYSVLEAFAVTCPARQHAIKKLLCAGIRGKGNAEQDLREVAVAIERAIVLECARDVGVIPTTETKNV